MSHHTYGIVCAECFNNGQNSLLYCFISVHVMTVEASCNIVISVIYIHIGVTERIIMTYKQFGNGVTVNIIECISQHHTECWIRLSNIGIFKAIIVIDKLLYSSDSSRIELLLSDIGAVCVGSCVCC